MWFKHSMSIALQLLPIYNTNVHKNKSAVALNSLQFPNNPIPLFFNIFLFHNTIYL